MDGAEDRQRISQWINESQYVIGRVIPGLLDDRDRLRGKLEATEQDSERLRQEIGGLRKEISDLQSETQYFRNEHAAIGETLNKVLDHMGQAQKPLSDAYRRLQVSQPVGLTGSTGQGGHPAPPLRSPPRPRTLTARRRTRGCVDTHCRCLYPRAS